MEYKVEELKNMKKIRLLHSLIFCVSVFDNVGFASNECFGAMKQNKGIQNINIDSNGNSTLDDAKHNAGQVSTAMKDLSSNKGEISNSINLNPNVGKLKQVQDKNDPERKRIFYKIDCNRVKIDLVRNTNEEAGWKDLVAKRQQLKDKLDDPNTWTGDKMHIADAIDSIEDTCLDWYGVDCEGHKLGADIKPMNGTWSSIKLVKSADTEEGRKSLLNWKEQLEYKLNNTAMYNADKREISQTIKMVEDAYQEWYGMNYESRIVYAHGSIISPIDFKVNGELSRLCIVKNSNSEEGRKGLYEYKKQLADMYYYSPEMSSEDRAHINETIDKIENTCRRLYCRNCDGSKICYPNRLVPVRVKSYNEKMNLERNERTAETKTIRDKLSNEWLVIPLVEDSDKDNGRKALSEWKKQLEDKVFDPNVDDCDKTKIRHAITEIENTCRDWYGVTCIGTPLYMPPRAMHGGF